jgi:hypothetical protein
VTPKQQLEDCIKTFSSEVAKLARAALATMRTLTPGATELVYDNYNALVIAFAPSERTSDAILSLALYPRWVNLFFAQGATLPDPTKRLVGSGARFRNVVLRAAADLDEPAVRDLIAAALSRAKPRLDPTQTRKLVIKSVSEKRRERRPKGAAK